MCSIHGYSMGRATGESGRVTNRAPMSPAKLPLGVRKIDNAEAIKA
jgi:hypothetical protein